MAKDAGFAAAFAAARKKLGAGKTFTYNGKSYSTNRADDKKSSVSASVPRPQPRPADLKPKGPGKTYSPTAAMAESARNKPAAVPNNVKPQPRPNRELPKPVGPGGKYSPTEAMAARGDYKPVPKSAPSSAPSSSGSDYGSTMDAMGNAYRKGGMVGKPAFLMGKGKPIGKPMGKTAPKAAPKAPAKGGKKPMMSRGGKAC